MNSQPDPRIAELEQLAREEGLRLPYPAHYIAWLEDRGRIVDLETGCVYTDVTVKLEASGRAVAHLLQDAMGEVAL